MPGYWRWKSDYWQQDQVDQLNREKETLVKENSLIQGSQDRLFQLETLSKKSEKNRKDMRAKVQALIKNLDKFDLAWRNMGEKYL